MAHWKKSFNPDYLGAFSIENGQDIIATIKSVGVEKVVGDKGRKEECLVCRFVEDIKPMILNKTNCKTISKIYKNPDTDSWIGKRIAIYGTTTNFAGDVVECLRIRNSIPTVAAKSNIKCESCGNPIGAAGGMSAEEFVNYSKKNAEGKTLCLACLRAYSAERKQANESN